ncbi:MAG TPA: potassium transporter Kup [Spirochaetia bacterium]|nr:potassium transporter Kup [Spirochaetia bacterium]
MGNPSPRRQNLALTVGAIGVVFGDIGTSPLYALRQCLSPDRGVAPSPENVIGIVSLLLWTLTFVVCFKYLAFVLRADNRGEGGILALVSQVSAALPKRTGKRVALVSLIGIVGAALLYSDSVLTPAVTILSAIEGLDVATPVFTPWIVPIVLFILLTLFAFQSGGTGKLAKLYGPILILWFLTLGILGVAAIVRVPVILQALNPVNAVLFVAQNWGIAFVILGSVFLAMTGAEVLYADMGHFGKSAIRRGWFTLVYPALILNYLGQGAFVLASGGQTKNLFFQIAPPWFLYPLVILATLASVIASQAVITGAFSLARQSIQLGFWPRMQVKHTSDHTIGQVYVPFINWVLMLGTVALVLGFRESGNLSNAYGIAVSADMLITSCLMLYLGRKRWKAPWPLLILLGAVFLTIDVTFFSANVSKVFSGGWIVVLTAILIFVLMKTWRDGRAALRQAVDASMLSLENFISGLGPTPPHRVKRTAVFLAGNPRGVPTALLHNLKHNRVLHELTLIVSVQTLEQPRVPEDQRAEVKDWGQGIWTVILNFGFSELPDVPQTLTALQFPGLVFNPHQTTYFLGRESLVVTNRKRQMSLWRKKLFWFMSHNALAATTFFRLPVNQVVEISAQTEL